MSQQAQYPVEPNREKHVLLFAMLRWFARHREQDYNVLAPDVVVLKALYEQEGPLGFYPRKHVRRHMYQLEEKGLTKRVSYYDKTLGWTLTQEGIDLLEEMGRPKQYDH